MPSDSERRERAEAEQEVSARGETVLAWIERLGALPERSIIEIARQMAAVLGRTSAAGLPPPAVTPARITVTRDGAAKLMSRVGGPRDAAPDSRHHASPERAAPVRSPRHQPDDGGRDPGRMEADAASDIRPAIYALGASLYHMATGRAPSESDAEAAVASKRAEDRLAWPSAANPAISAGLSRIIAKMMAKDPEERYGTPTELSRDLDLVSRGQDPVSAARVPPSSAVAPRGRSPAATARDAAGPSGGAARVRRPAPTTRPRREGRKARPDPSETAAHPHVRRPEARPRRAEEVRPIIGHELWKRLEPSEEAKRHAERLKVLAAIGSGVVVVGALVAIAVFGGGDGRPGSKPSSGKPGAGDPEYEVERAVRAADELRAMDALNVARKYALDHPDDFEEALDKFKQALSLAAGTSLEEEAAATTQAHRARWKEAALDALAAVERVAEELAAAGDYDRACAALMQLDPKLSPQVASELIEATTRLTTEGRKRISAVLAEAEELAAARDTSGAVEAREKLKELDRIRFEVGLGEVAPRLEALLKSIDEMRGEKRIDQAEEKAKPSG